MVTDNSSPLWRRASRVLVGVISFGSLLLALSPTQMTLQPPPLGPAKQDIAALRDFTDVVPVADIAGKRARAAEIVPVVYSFKSELVTHRITKIRDAFRLIRPKHRLYLADRDKLVQERDKWLAREREVKVVERVKLARKGAPLDLTLEIRERIRANNIALKALDSTHELLLGTLRPAFARKLCANPDTVTPEVFRVLRANGFDEEIELLLSDVLQVALTQRIVRDNERLQDDLSRGVLDGGLRYGRSNAGTLGAVELQQARQQSERYVDAFIRRKAPSRFDRPALKEATRRLARGLVEPTFVRDASATFAAEKRARAAVAEVTDVVFRKGQSLVKRGDMVTPMLQKRVARMIKGLEHDGRVQVLVATAMILALFVVLFAVYLARAMPIFANKPKDVWLLVTILWVHGVTLRLMWELGQLALTTDGTLTTVMWTLALPFALGPTLATLFFRAGVAVPFTVLCAALAGLMTYNQSGARAAPEFLGLVPIIALLLGFAGVFATRRFRARADLAQGGLIVTLVGLVAAIAVAMLLADPTTEIVSLHNGLIVVAGSTSGALSYLLVAALTPLLESGFNRLTDIKLLELTSMNHPALRKLASEVPGTFTHSVMVANLAEAACEAINANGLLARVGAYYHDVGKLKAPQYFAENQMGENPHDRLKPRLSALIIRSHVKDGIEMLREYGLPEEIIDFVPQHHGTSLVEFFFSRAQQQAETSGEEVLEEDFRYPGPKPQTKEAALMMIADTLEAAGKALPDPTEDRIRILVQRVIANKVNDNQLDECDMTLRELAAVER
ncbi:MAG TPA: hypothetical protein DCQ06_12305, partial [Myxococcales bacterium]|nr:hypothetical protein [Myxococcales bacterium]